MTVSFPDLERAKTKSDKLIVLAKAAGYRADEFGTIYSPEGKRLSGGVAKSGHLNFMPIVVPRKQRSSVLQHRFVAYYFLGAAVFDAPLVRHLNDIPNDNRIANLAPGTFAENRADIPRERISATAKRNAPTLVARSRKLTDEAVRALRTLRAETGASYKNLAEMFGISPMTAYRAISKQSWSNV